MLADPVSSAETFRTEGYALVKHLVSAERAARLRDHLEGRAKSGTLRMTGDDQVPNTPHVYGDAQVDALMLEIKPLVEAHTGYRLHPTYSYARIYKKGDTLEAHRDRPACQISVSLNLGQEPDAPWALNIEKDDVPFAAMMRPGDALLYKGMEKTHWRDAYEGERMFQVFVHYVDADGPHAGEKFDSRASLGNAFMPEMTGLLTGLMVPKYTDR